MYFPESLRRNFVSFCIIFLLGLMPLRFPVGVSLLSRAWELDRTGRFLLLFHAIAHSYQVANGFQLCTIAGSRYTTVEEPQDNRKGAGLMTRLYTKGLGKQRLLHQAKEHRW